MKVHKSREREMALMQQRVTQSISAATNGVSKMYKNAVGNILQHGQSSENKTR